MLPSQQQFEKCPKHPQNDIVLFCLASSCKEPLCKDCCKLHIHWHNQQGTQAEIDTVDNVRQTLIQDIHSIKIRFEEERAILHHFSDGEHSELIKSVHAKVEKVKKTLNQVVNDYCLQLEENIRQRITQHKQAHPGEKKELHHKLNSVIQDLDQQEKSLLQPKYIRPCLIVISSEQNHNLEHFQKEIDQSLKHYLANMFDVFIHEDKLKNIVNSLHEYVEIHQANMTEELDIYTKKLREGKKVYGMESERPILQNSNIRQQYTQNQFAPQPISGQRTNIFDYPNSNQKLAQTVPIRTISPVPKQPQYEKAQHSNNSMFLRDVQPSQIVQTKAYDQRIQSNQDRLRGQF